jgi:hypothetical protein
MRKISCAKIVTGHSSSQGKNWRKIPYSKKKVMIEGNVYMKK